MQHMLLGGTPSTTALGSSQGPMRIPNHHSAGSPGELFALARVLMAILGRNVHKDVRGAQCFRTEA
eukprot:CAMPEP_0185840034 /NCGR_PEP_ID=MMETSP1353-20130828/15570_1 /TAXON_ID=1077150 /ORGANISM="Erythrolobus australicus, Strain CCMP3124" /LENGTH=65 /DNA_ID=CAMNT_0028539301 /DNA_START=917 /DNA_END=1110 /DNA_ORIENTATION=-